MLFAGWGSHEDYNRRVLVAAIDREVGSELLIERLVTLLKQPMSRGH